MVRARIAALLVREGALPRARNIDSGAHMPVILAALVSGDDERPYPPTRTHRSELSTLTLSIWL